MSHTVHNGNHYALTFSPTVPKMASDRWDECKTVHCGMAFATIALLSSPKKRGNEVASTINDYGAGPRSRIKRGRVPKRHLPVITVDLSEPKTEKVALIDLLNDDAIRSILMALSATNDVASLCAIQSCCTYLAPLAREALIAIPLIDRVKGLLAGTLPLEMSIEAERQAAAGLLRGDLPGSLMRAAYELANEAVISASPWTLSSEPEGQDCGGDLSFHLRGFDSTPLEERHDVLTWYAEHQPSRPLTKLQLPCVMAGPPRYIALAGSERQKRAVRRIPLELCRVVRRPAAGFSCEGLRRGYAMIDELLRLARAADAAEEGEQEGA